MQPIHYRRVLHRRIRVGLTMIKAKISLAVAGSVLLAQQGFAGIIPMGSPVLGAEAMSTAMPFGMGGAAAIAAVSLILGIQLIKRKK